MTAATAGVREATLARLRQPLPSWLRPLLVALALIGAVAFLLLALGAASSDRAWRAFHVNWLFWTGLSQAGVLFSATQIISKSRWSHPLRRIAEASVAFLPVSFVLFLVLWLGRSHIFPWVAAPVAEWPKSFWLRDWFVWLRDGAGMLFLYALSFWFIARSLRSDRAGGEELARTELTLTRLAAGLIPAYGVVMSLVAFDMIMSLAPHWYSNLLGAYYFMAAWLMGLMTLALTTIWWRRHLRLETVVTGKTLHDLGKLCFGFTVFWAYLFFSQFIVIWYGNMPEETSFMMLRIAATPWRPVGILMVCLVFVIPFWGLMGVVPKKTPAILGTFAVISLVGLWLDRWVFVVPSVAQGATRVPLGLPEVLVTAGFAGLWGLAHLWFAKRWPIVSPRLLQRMEEEAGAHH